MLATLHEVQKKFTQDECSICLCLKNAKDLAIMDCSHTFHATCLFEWFSKKKGPSSCPICNVGKCIVHATSTASSRKSKKHETYSCKEWLDRHCRICRRSQSNMQI